MSSPLPILSGEIGDLISALNRLSLALENHLAASGSHPASSVPDSAQLVDSPWILVEEEELPRGYKHEREYTPADPIRIQDTHYLVLRSWNYNPRLIKLPCRVRTKSDLALIVGNPPSPGSLVQSFASLTEVQIFCGGANIPVPPLFQWRSQKKA